MGNTMAAWILAQNEECHDVATSPELALVAGFEFSHVLAAACGRHVVIANDDAPVSSVQATVRPSR